MQKIDVVVLTKNSEYMLCKCLNSIYKNVPVKKLIVIDGYSEDKTLKIIANFHRKYRNINVVSEKGSRARAREVGISKVKTEWFLFVDSDVILSYNWYENAKLYVTKDVGAIWGVNIDVIPRLNSRIFLKLQRLVAKQCFHLRGGTHDTLIRKSSVADIKIPEKLHTYEDAYLIKRIKKKGYKAVVGKNIFCLHLKPAKNWELKNAIASAVLEVKCGLIYSKNFLYSIYYPFFMMFWFLQFTLENFKKS